MNVMTSLRLSKYTPTGSIEAAHTGNQHVRLYHRLLPLSLACRLRFSRRWLTLWNALDVRSGLLPGHIEIIGLL